LGYTLSVISSTNPFFFGFFSYDEYEMRDKSIFTAINLIKSKFKIENYLLP